MIDSICPFSYNLTTEGLWLITQFCDFRYVDPFLSYSRSKSKVVRNRFEFWTFFAPPQILLGDPFQDLCPCYHKGVVLRSLIKFCGVTPSSSKVIATLNFKSILNIRFYFFGGGIPIPFVVCARKPRWISNVCKNIRGHHPIGAEIWSLEKNRFYVGPNSHDLLSGQWPKFIGRVSLNALGIIFDHMSFQFWTSCLIPQIFAIKVGSCVNRAKFCMFCPIFSRPY